MRKILSLIIFMLIAGLVVDSVALAASTSIKRVAFRDVASTHWAKEGIDLVSSNGFMGGYPDGTFRPEGTITRAEFTIVLTRILGISTAESTVFVDITDHWASSAIQSAVAAGLITDQDYGSVFSPDKPITRLEMARMMARALAKDEAYRTYLKAFKGLYNGDLPFVDYRDFPTEEIPFLALTFGSRIMNGYPDSSFGLKKNATRAEAAVMFKNLIDSRTKSPEDFQYLQELKEIADTGMNAKAISDLIPQVNLQDEEILVEHSNFTAKLNRVYIMPISNDVSSMYERKFIWDRSNLPENYLNGKKGFFVGVVDITFKKDGERTLYTQYLYMSPSSAFYMQEPHNNFGFVFPYMKSIYKAVKGNTEEVVLYGVYGDGDFVIGLQTNDALEGGWHRVLLNPVGRGN